MTSNSTEKTTSPTPVKLTELTETEVIESLTGYDELAIKNKFGSPIGALLDEAISTCRRALTFVLYTREENGPKDAYKAAMNLTVRELSDVFADDEDEVNDEDPVTESGKDDSPLVKQPTSSPTSAS